MWQPRRQPLVDFPLSVSLAGLSLVAPQPLEEFVSRADVDVAQGGKFRQIEVLYTSFFPPPFFWEYRCSHCRQYEAPNGCAWVGGAISPDGWCTLWVPPKDAEPPFSWLGRLPAALVPQEGAL